jgi:uncharacterized damage-inducible protein DinB
MPLFTPELALRDLPKTPVILNAILRGVDQARAQSATDGADGWSVVEVVCHLNEYEKIFTDRALLLLASEVPTFESFDQAALARENHYTEQNLREVLASFIARRRAHLELLRGLAPEQWQRRAIHPVRGEVSLVELATYTTLHDVNHIEQIVKALGASPDLAAL